MGDAPLACNLQCERISPKKTFDRRSRARSDRDASFGEGIGRAQRISRRLKSVSRAQE